MDEKRYTPRAHLDDSGDRYTNRAVLLSSGQEHCERINFHVLVSLIPSRPTNGAQAPTRKGQRARGGAAMGEAENSAGAADLREASQWAVSWTMTMAAPYSCPREKATGVHCLPPHNTLL